MSTPGGFLTQPLRAGRIAAYVLLAVLGVLVGAAGSLVQAAWFPGGLLLALLGAAGVFLGGARALGGQGGVFAPAVGWLLAVVVLTVSRPEGDFVFAAGLSTYLYLLGGIGVAVMCATVWLPRQPAGPVARLGK
ncbi:DUF6113 family protein [Streptomyces sp. E11-3]|uniref:DUF6113 family protein n=1 Tax=Streptomyces sp. E11-3 TaxID=3110112 RepID=UPI00397F7078